MRTLLVVLAVLAAPVLSALGPERPVGPVVYGLAPDFRMRPRVAVNDHGGLAVWWDGRRGGASVYGARFDRTGRLLDPAGRLIAEDGNALDVVWTGRTWLIVYLEYPLLRMRTMSADGVVGAPVTLLNTESILHDTVRLAANGTSVAMVTNRGTGRILDLDGNVLRSFSFSPPPEQFHFSIDVAPLGEAYGIAYTAMGGVEFRSLSADGTVGAPQLLPVSPRPLNVALGSDGRSFLTVFNDGAERLFAQKLDASGAAAGERRTLSAERAAAPSIAWGGSDYLVTYSRVVENIFADPMSLRLTRDGEVAAPPSQFADRSEGNSTADVARRADGSGIAVSISTSRIVQGAIFDAGSAEPRTVRPLSMSAAAQRDVQVAGEGGTLVTAWVEATATNHEVRLAHGVGGRSIVVDESPFARLAEVLVDGQEVWVVWVATHEERTRLWARRYSTSLEPIGGARIEVLSSDGRIDGLAIAAGGGAVMAVFAGGLKFPGIFGRLVRPDGTRVDLELREGFMEYNAAHPAAAWNGREFVLVWSDARDSQWWQFPDPVEHHVVAVRIGTDGTVRDAKPLIVSDEPNVSHTTLAAAPADGAVLVAWQGGSVVPHPNGRTTSIVRFDGHERPAARVIDEPAVRRLVSLAAVGQGAAVLWWTLAAVDYAFLDAGFAVEERGTLAVRASNAEAASRGAQPVIAYTRVAEEAEYGGVYRAFVRTLAPARRRASR